MTQEQKYLYFWEYNVNAMNFFDIPDHYKSSIELDKYGRFTGFLQEYVTSLFKGGRGYNDFDVFNVDKKEFPRDWWQTAIKVANGKKVKNNIPQMKNASYLDKLTVYNNLIPAYRVLKDNFDNRRWYEWFTNHDQYTAERDSIKALTGLMTSLLGATKDDIEEALRINKESVSSSGVSVEERKEHINSSKKEKMDEIGARRIKMLLENGGNLFGPNENSENLMDDSVREIFDDPAIAKSSEALFTEEERADLAEEYAFTDGAFGEEIEGIDDISAEINADKEQVIFEKSEFSEFDNSFDIQQPIDEKDEPFLDNEKEIGF